MLEPGSDARDEEQLIKLHRETEIGEVEVFVFNIGGNVRFDIRDTTSRVYREVWEMTAFAGFLARARCQKRSAWIFEMDLRPWTETW